MPPDIALTATLARVPSGTAGVFHSLRKMRALVTSWRTSPDIVSFAVSTIFLTPAKDTDSEARVLFEWVRDQVRYTRDILNVETISTPVMTIARRVGDCDDKAVLLATLCESVGYPTRFVMAAFDGTCDYSHVWVQIMTDSGWVDADATEETRPFGWVPPDITCIYTEH